MFSPADIQQFINLLRNAVAMDIDLSKIYGEMVKGNYSYRIQFNGTVDDIPSDIFNGRNNLSVDKEYKRNVYSYSRKGRERKFLKWLIDERGVDIGKISFVRINEDGTEIEKISLDGNKREIQKC